ncbi:MAG TPA: hypothetical protein RMH99_15305 [Sandaracinaceae bacterium LLY-WYZ-13_1]|nr:hypothetical protein [Sandaracinaceae bacterium LLY-WYZ-13_1]
MDAPPRDATRFCIDCRTLLDADETCDAGRFHRVVSLADDGGRERVRAQVWGPPDLRHRAANAAKVGGAGAFIQAAMDSCACPLEAAASVEGLFLVVAAMLLVFVVVGSAYWAIASLVSWIRRRRARLRPTGVRPPRPPPGDRFEGTVAAGARCEPPVGEEAGVAWGLEATSSDAIGAGPVLLCAGHTAGFRVELRDGRTLEVPAGRVRWRSGDEAETERVPGPTLRRWLASLDHREADEPHPPLPADRGRVRTLRIGDRVELAADVERVAGAGAGYREGAGQLRARGVPVIVSRSSA